MRKLFCICIISCFYFQMYSQFKDGYIITYANDTTFGLINNEGSILNSHSFQFKKDINNVIQTYTPNDIKAFRFIDGKYYVSRIVKINEKDEKVFLEWLIKGKASILCYPTFSNGFHYYLSLGSDSLIELKNTKDTIVDADYKRFAHEKKEYIRLLNYYFNGFGMQSEITTTQFNANSLIKIAKDYHYKACNNKDCEVFEDKSKKLKFQIGLSFSSYNSNLFISDSYNTKVQLANSFGLGLLINLSNLPYLSPNFSLQIGANYYSVLYKYTNTDFGYVTDDGGKLFSINLIRIPIQMEYKFQTKVIQPYIGIGFVDNLRINNTIYNNVYQNWAQASQQFIPLQQFGILSIVGINYNISEKFSLKCDLTFEYASSFFTIYPTGNNVNFIAQFGIFFKLN